MATTAGEAMRVHSTVLRGRRSGIATGGGTAQLSFTPATGFAPGEKVSVSLPAGMTSTTGAALSKQVYQFTVAAGGTGRGFFIDTTLVASTGSTPQVLGDIDNDGDLDLLIGGALYGFQVFLNTGQGHYQLKTGVIAAEELSSLTLADVDQDGDLDVLVADAENNTVSICLNNGSGDFIGSVTGAQNAPVGARPVGVATGDIDGDGDLDFVTANADGSSSTVYYNGGPYTAIGIHYYTPVTVQMGAGPTSVALADIDNDGDLDLLTTNQGSPASPVGEVHVSRNTGAGTFGSYTRVLVGLQPTSMALADVDKDGDLDLLTADSGAASVSLRVNNGSGTFSGTTTLALPAGSTPGSLCTGDVDADGDLDLLVAQGRGGRIYTYLNTAGLFTLQARPLRLSRATAASATSVQLGDVDGDLDLDVVSADEQGRVIVGRNANSAPLLSPPIISSLNPGSGPVGASITLTGSALVDVTAVNFNGVAAPGFALNGTGTEIRVVVPSGATSGPVTVVTEEAGMATSPAPFTVTVPIPVLLTATTPRHNTPAAPRSGNLTLSFDKAISAASAGQLRVFGNTRRGRLPGTLSGGGTANLVFDPAQDFAPGEVVSVSLPASLRSLDDQAVSPGIVQFTAATGGTGQLRFTATTVSSVPNPGEPILGDLDNDGDLDLLTPNPFRNVVNVRLNNGQGIFSPGTDVTIGQFSSSSLVLGDVDADGDLDLGVDCSGGSLEIWLNQGDGRFGNVRSVLVNQNITRTAFGDVDADGDLDVVVLNGQEIAVRLNDGTGRFSGSYNFWISGGETLTSLALGDVDADRRLDILVAGTGAGGAFVSVYHNEGPGSFSLARKQMLRAGAGRLVLGDLDGDGDLDVAAQCTVNASQRASIGLNDGAGVFTFAADVPLPGTGLVLADGDADGDLDLFTHGYVALNNGTGGFDAVSSAYSSTTYPGGTTLGDVDGDLDLDVVTSESNNTVSVLLNNPAPAPAIASLNPASGAVGTTVLVTGSNLVGTQTVTVNGVTATFVVRSVSELTVQVPVGASTGDLRLTTLTGAAAMPFAVTQPIAVQQVAPTRHSVAAPANSPVTLNFSQPISAGSAGQVRVVSSQQGVRAGTVTGGGSNTLTFMPARPFAPGEAVSVSVPARVTGTAGGAVIPHVTQFSAATGGTGTGLFMTTGTTDVPIRYRAISLATGDLNNDGYPDVLTTEGSVRLNNGDGSFRAATNVALYGEPWHVALADLNADGKPDVLTTTGRSLLNASDSATFAEMPNFHSPNWDARDLAVGDLDGDGDIDVAQPKYSADSVYFYFNDGTGRFPRYQRVGVGDRPVGVAIGDVDNDGDLDVLVASEGLGASASTVSVCFNNGQGLFLQTQRLAAGHYIGRIALGDLDADGDLDLVTNNGLVRFNNGLGSFSGTQTVPGSLHLVLGDVDADGDLDLVTIGSSTTVSLNNGQGQFSPGPALSFTDTFLGLSLADIDGDGDLDALAGGSGASGSGKPVIQLRLNQRIGPPLISGFSPASGLPGATVELTGTDFIGVTRVEFNGIVAPNFVVNSASHITVVVPAGATTGPIRVTNPRGTATSSQAFTVLVPVAVLSVSPAPHTVAPANSAVTVQFGQAMPVNSPATLAVFSQERGGLLSGTRQGAGTSTLSLQPAQALRPGELVSVSIPAYIHANQTRVEKQVYQFRAAVGGTGRGFFDPATVTATGSMPESLVLGDVNGDGSPDMVTVHDTSVELRLNNGAGTFGPATVIFSSGTLYRTGKVALGDLDGDGDLDLAAIDPRPNTVEVRFNNGRGQFSGTQAVGVGPGPAEISLADMDADGDLDIVTGNQGTLSCTTSVRFNDGSGTFSGTVNEFLGYGSNTPFSNMPLGDVDGDGDLDALVSTDTNAILLNDGHGRLVEAAVTLPLPGGADVLLTDDVDRDGDLDVLGLYNSSTGGLPSVVRVCRNDGRGNFIRTDLPMAAEANHISLGDVDADGDADLLVSAGYGTQAELWLNDGQGTYRKLMSLDLGVMPIMPVFSDVDNDGDLDLVHANYQASTYSIRLNGPTPPPVVASFSPGSGPEGTTVVVTGSGFLGTTAVQFNATPAPGFVINSPTQLTVKVPAGASTGTISVITPVATARSAATFTVLPVVKVTSTTPGGNAASVARNAPVTLTFTNPITAASAGNLRVFGSQLRGRRSGRLTGGGTATLSFDPDQDFAPGELVSVSVPATLQTSGGEQVRSRIYQFTAATGGTGGGLFRGGSDIVVGWSAPTVVLGDVDNDGYLDLLTPVQGQYTTGLIKVELNDGTGHFQTGTSINTNSSQMLTHVALGDVDADGDLDVVAGSTMAPISVCLNYGNGTFAPAQKLSSMFYDQLVLGDLDADGDLDLVAIAYQLGTLKVALNNGNGIFQSQSYTLASPSAFSVVLGDADNDGDLDALTANDADGAYLYLNDGAGTLATGVALPTIGQVRGAQLGDVDADGNLDVVLAYSQQAYGTAWLTTLHNTGMGTFVATGQRTELGQTTNRLLLADVDHDGDLDALAANGGSNDVAVRPNNGTGVFSKTANVPVSSNPGSMALGDVDGDGDLDFAVLEYATGSALLNVRLNDGLLTAITPAASALPLALYPNPAREQVVVVVPAALRTVAGPLELHLYNALGQRVLDQALRPGADGTYRVRIAHLPAGVYTARIVAGQQVSTARLTVY